MNLMEKRFILLFVLLFSVSFVFAADGWGDIITDGEEDKAPVEDDDSGDVEAVPIVYEERDSLDADTKYTLNFYIAVGVAIVGVLIAAFFIYLFLRSPKDRWKKNSKIVK